MGDFEIGKSCIASLDTGEYDDGNINSDPLLFDYLGNGDRRLLPDSPAIDVADHDYVPVDYADVDGSSSFNELLPIDLNILVRERPTETPDMGAYEFTCLADLTGDGVVNGADTAIVLAHWSEEDWPGDLDGQSPVNGGDLGVVIGNWGDCPGGSESMMGGGGPTLEGIAEDFGFETYEEFSEWLDGLSPEARWACLSTYLGF